MLFNMDTFTIVGLTALRSVWIVMRTSARAILVFEKSDIAFTVLVLLKLAVNAVFAVLKTASLYQNRIYILL